jgi:hypothetical protein
LFNRKTPTDSGVHLHGALDGRIPVIGAAKTQYPGAENAQEITRG